MVNAILDALRRVQDPDLKKDLVSLNMIQDLRFEKGTAYFRVVLTTPACPLKKKMQADCTEAVMAVAGVEKVEIQMDAEVKGRKGVQSIPGVGHIIAVSSGKGGVGKSTVAVNLAMALAQEGAQVGLMDADVYGPNIPTMMGVTDQPKIVTHEKGEVFLPPMSHGIKVMSMGFLIPGDQPLVWRGPMLHNVVNQFCYQVDWGKLDYLVIDMPPGTGDVQLSLAQLVPVTGAILVTTPQEVSMQDVRKAYYMFEKVRIPILGIVENMSYFKCSQCAHPHYIFGQEGGHTLAQKFGTPLLAQVPLVAQVREGGDEGKPIVLRDPQGEVGQIFQGLAQKIAQQVSILTFDASQLVQIGRFN